MSSILFNLPKYKAENGRPHLLRVIVSKTYTRIDFGYQTNPIYENGGWVTIAPDTFLRIKKTKQQLKILKTENIPIGPKKHHFESTTDNLYFSLFFPPLPASTTTFDLIEEEPVTPTVFNYYKIKLDSSSAITLID